MRRERHWYRRMPMASIAEDTQWLDATAQAELVRNGDTSALELVNAAIERIEAHDGPLNSVVMRWFDHARDTAVDDFPNGAFTGVPFLLKDLWSHYTGQVLTNGNAALAAARPVSDFDTNLVGKFRAAGLVTVGRSSSPELGSVPVTEPIPYGPARNPWSTDRTPGGSSGGAAAAVAAGLVPIAHASDGGGSIRIPASCCGLVGLKPSQGRVSTAPRSETGLGVELCVSRSVRDTARMLDAVNGPAIGDTVIAAAPSRPYVDELGADPGRLRIGLLDHHPQGAEVHDDCVAAVRSAATLLDGLGHAVEPGFPELLADADLTPRFMALWATNMATGLGVLANSLGRELTEAEVEPVNWAQAQFAKGLTAEDYALAVAATVASRRGIQQWWADGWDLLLTPTLALPPLKIGEIDPTPGDPLAGMRRAADFVPFTPAFNVSGQPAISLPLHWSDSGLPIGVQLVAAYGREDVLIQVASQLEAAQPWANRKPPLA